MKQTVHMTVKDLYDALRRRGTCTALVTMCYDCTMCFRFQTTDPGFRYTFFTPADLPAGVNPEWATLYPNGHGRILYMPVEPDLFSKNPGPDPRIGSLFFDLQEFDCEVETADRTEQYTIRIGEASWTFTAC